MNNHFKIKNETLIRNQNCNNQQSMNYYLVKVKLGHVGKTKYLPMNLPIRAKTLKEAANKARNHGGVKRNHKDWCLEIPRKITKEEYEEYKIQTYIDEYWNKTTRRNFGSFIDRLVNETNLKKPISEVDVQKRKRTKNYKAKKIKATYDYYESYEYGEYYGGNYV